MAKILDVENLDTKVLATDHGKSTKTKVNISDILKVKGSKKAPFISSGLHVTQQAHVLSSSFFSFSFFLLVIYQVSVFGTPAMC